MNLTSAVALMLGMWVFSGCGWDTTHAKLRSNIVVKTDAGTRGRGDTETMNMLPMNATWYQATNPSPGSSFQELCQQQASLSAERRKTVEVLLAEAGTSDCELAAKNLSSRTELYLRANSITDVSPLSRLTNLRVLVLGFNQITDISPLAGLTNLIELDLHLNSITDFSPLARLTKLEKLYLTDNPLTQPVCPISPPTVCEFENLPPAKTY